MGDPRIGEATRQSQGLLVLAFALFALATRPSAAANLVYVLLGAAILAIAVRRRFQPATEGLEPQVTALTWIVALALALSALFDVRLPQLPEGRLTAWFLISSASIAILGAVFVISRARGIRPYSVALILVVVAVSSMLLIRNIDPEPAIDVWDLHQRAAERLADGQSPYRDLQVPSTSPDHPPGTLIDGYVYPPATLLWFSLGAWAGDARLASLAAWIITLGLISRFIKEEWRSQQHLATGLLLLFALQPGWIFVLDQSWTEPFTLMLLFAAFYNWSKRPLASGLLLGLALVTKQYMVVLAPLFFLVPDRHRIRRISAAAAAGLAVVLPFVIWDAQGIWDATVVFHLETAPRADGSNLAGLSSLLDLDITPPAWMAILLPSVVGGFLGRKARTTSDIVLSVTATLAAFFLLATQAFANYWFLVAGTAVLTLLVDHPGVLHDARRPKAPPA